MFLLFLAMVIQCLDLLLGCLACVVLHELILICVVLVLFMLTAIKLFFVFSLLWLIKLILVPVNFVTVYPWVDSGGSSVSPAGRMSLKSTMTKSRLQSIHGKL
jgi:hypothetical protein